MTFDVLDPIDPIWLLFYVASIGLVHFAEGLRMLHYQFAFPILLLGTCLRLLVAGSIAGRYYLRDIKTDWRTIMLLDFVWTASYILLYCSRILWSIIKARRKKAKEHAESGRTSPDVPSSQGRSALRPS